MLAIVEGSAARVKKAMREADAYREYKNFKFLFKTPISKAKGEKTSFQRTPETKLLMYICNIHGVLNFGCSQERTTLAVLPINSR